MRPNNLRGKRSKPEKDLANPAAEHAHEIGIGQPSPAGVANIALAELPFAT